MKFRVWNRNYFCTNLITTRNSSTEHKDLVLALLEAVQLPTRAALVHCGCHQREGSFVSQGHGKADQTAEQSIPVLLSGEPPGPEEPGGLQSTGLQRVRHDWAWQHTHGIRWPKVWSFNFSISPSNEYAGLISFRMDWFDILAVLGPHRSLLQHHSLKTSVLQCSAFFMVQLSHNYCKNHSFDYTDLCWQRNASAF